MSVSDDYAEYEKACTSIREQNEKLIDEFAEWLERRGLSDATVGRHCGNIEFYVNHYLLYEDAMEAKDGVGRIGMFLGYWFIRKAMWASEASIKSSAASLKKFYTFMLEKGEVDGEDVADLKETIKEEMPMWLATLSRYDNPDIEDPAEVWGL